MFSQLRRGPSTHLCEDDYARAFIPGMSLPRISLHYGGQLDIVRCPLCGGRMVTRVNRQGPYFHCLCTTKSMGTAVSALVRAA
jgi:hypothetical protein